MRTVMIFILGVLLVGGMTLSSAQQGVPGSAPGATSSNATNSDDSQQTTGANEPASPSINRGVSSGRVTQQNEAVGFSDPQQTAPTQNFTDPRSVLFPSGDPRAGTGNTIFNDLNTDSGLNNALNVLVNSFGPATSNVVVGVQEGVVTLNGVISDPGVAQQLITTISSVSNVRFINDNLMVGTTVPGGNTTGVAVNPFSERAVSDQTFTNSDPRLSVFGTGDPRAGTDTGLQNSQTNALNRNFNSANPSLNANPSATSFATGPNVAGNDTDLRANIQTMLNNLSVPTGDIVVETQGGVVTLSGMVANQQQADAIIALIRSMGVSQVNSELIAVNNF